MRGTALSNVMTVDVEDYFQVSAFAKVVARDRWDRLESRVASNTMRVLHRFACADVKATFFVLGWVAQRLPQLVRDIADGGHELASHGYGHELVYQQTPEEFRRDVRRAKKLLEDISGIEIQGYRAPSFSITAGCEWALDVLVEEGYRYDASVFPIHHHRYGAPLAPRHMYEVQHNGSRLIRVPAATVRICGTNLPIAGGGYFRLVPYRCTQWGIRRVNQREDQPVVFYIHPWELDPNQPRVAAPLLTRLRHYLNLAKTEGRLCRLLQDFEFVPIRTVLEERAYLPPSRPLAVQC